MATALGSRPVSYYVATVRSPRRKVATQKSPYDLTVNIQPTLLDCSYISCLVVLILTTLRGKTNSDVQYTVI